jgi:hypothetical protein
MLVGRFCESRTLSGLTQTTYNFVIPISDLFSHFSLGLCHSTLVDPRCNCESPEGRFRIGLAH